MNSSVAARIGALFGREEASDCALHFYLSPDETGCAPAPRIAPAAAAPLPHDPPSAFPGPSDLSTAHKPPSAIATVYDGPTSQLSDTRACEASEAGHLHPQATGACADNADSGGGIDKPGPRMIRSPLPAHRLVLWTGSELFRAQLSRWTLAHHGSGKSARPWERSGSNGGSAGADGGSGGSADNGSGSGWGGGGRSIVQLRVPLGSDRDLPSALAAVQFMYTGQVAWPETTDRGGDGGPGGVINGSCADTCDGDDDVCARVAWLLSVRRLAEYLQVDGCAEACDELLLGVLAPEPRPSCHGTACGGGGPSAVQRVSRPPASGGSSSLLAAPPAVVAAASRSGSITVGSSCSSGGGSSGANAAPGAAPAYVNPPASASLGTLIAVLRFAETCCPADCVGGGSGAAATTATTTTTTTSFSRVVAACQRHLTAHFGDALAVLNTPRLRRALAGLPACALEALLRSDSLRADSESSVAHLLADWLAANPQTPPERMAALCRCVRVAHLSRAYLAFVLPGAPWWPMGHREQILALHLATAPQAERQALADHMTSSLELDEVPVGEGAGGSGGGSGGGGACADPWVADLTAPQRPPCAATLAFRWTVSVQALLEAMDKGGDATAEFEGGLPAVAAGGLEWSVFVSPVRPRPAARPTPGVSGSSGVGMSSGGGSGASGPLAGVYLRCQVPHVVEFGVATRTAMASLPPPVTAGAGNGGSDSGASGSSSSGSSSPASLNHALLTSHGCL
ncbi:hypothetical protein GPECTOR_23g116 [Gonium pectorale]|uniref:BACK domain-containing protein n=1 Tax=Gonium pectorale TaxID=33097 RepID=A0A150GGR7_GONPE|nr:hypothetical protein GPECTOR_23g116 [Gonium pectorale]|eukprot:KXZ49028.1 hypothetical protein GPECTOR_23g116 [Gonium pectorale]